MKKVLIITYYWPPSGGIGVLRCLKFVKYLRSFGWEPIVICPSNADYPYYDESNFKDIPRNLKVIRVPITEPFRAFKWLTNRKNVPLNNIVHVKDRSSIFDNLGIWIRGNFFIPDARAWWIGPAVKKINEFLKTETVDAIFSDGPPHTNTVIATRVSQANNLPFLADFQDPWTQVDYYKLFKIGKRADKKHKAMEQETFKTARMLTIASPSWKHDIEAIGAPPTEVIYYGYDEDDFAQLTATPDEKFTLCHSGLLGYDRNPENLFQALRLLLIEEPDLTTKLELKLVGQVDKVVLNSIKVNGLLPYLNNMGTVSRSTSLQEIANAWLLLLPLNKADNVKGRIPGKLFEYLRAKRPVICFGPEETDVSRIIEKHHAGANFDWSEVETLKNYIQEQFVNFKNGLFLQPGLSTEIEVYSNELQTKKLALLLNKISK